MKVIFLLLMFLVSPVFGSPPPGVYELYDGSGKRTGTITSKVFESAYGEKPSTQLEIKTEIEVPQVVSSYRFSEVDTAHLQDGILVYFRRETNDNGKKSVATGERRGSSLFLFAERGGQKITTAVPSSAFDITEFEMDMPASKFTALKNGETTALRVLMVETFKPVVVSRNIFNKVNFQHGGKKVSALVTTTVSSGRSTTSWFDAKTHDLLQEEGPNHLMSKTAE